MAHTQQANRISGAAQSQPRKFWMRWRVRLGYPVALIYWLLALSGQRDSRSRIRRRLLFLDRRPVGELVLWNFLLRRDAQRGRRSPRPLWRRFQRLRLPRTAFLSESLRERKISISGELGDEQRSQRRIFLGPIPPQSRISSPVRRHRSNGNGVPANVHSRPLRILSGMRMSRGKKPRSSGPSRSTLDRDDLRPLNLRRESDIAASESDRRAATNSDCGHAWEEAP